MYNAGNPETNNAHSTACVPTYLPDFSPAMRTRNSEVLRKSGRIYCSGRHGLHDLPEMSNILWLDLGVGSLYFPRCTYN